jgi:cysteine-rich repeat protein
MTSTAAGAMCGDGTLDPGEDCDGSDLGGANCTDLGFTNPSGAKCTATCTLDYGDCASVCGNGNVEPDEECDDGNTSGAYDGCSSTCHLLGTSCADAIPIALALGTMTLSGSTALVDDNFQPAQTMGCGDSSGGDLVFAISPATSGFVTAWLPRAATTFDSVAYIRQSCDDPTSQVLCNDNYVEGGSNNDDGGELVSVYVPQGQTIYLVIDGFQGQSGDFSLSLDLSKGDACSDPVPLTIEGSSDIVVLGNTQGFANDAAASAACGNAGAGPDAVYQVTTPVAGTYSFVATAGFNTVTYARSTCGDSGSQIACDAPLGTNDSNVDVTTQNNGAPFVWVDGTSGSAGNYRLTISH